MAETPQVQELHRRTSLIEQTISGVTNQIAEMFAAVRELGTRMVKTESANADLERRILKLETDAPTAKTDGSRKKPVCETKERMEAIEVYKGPEDFPKLLRQVRINMNGRYPFSGRWFSAMSLAVDTETEAMATVRLTTAAPSGEEYDAFIDDLWNILTLRISGKGAGVINLLLEKHQADAEHGLRAPAAWHSIQKDSRGHTTDRLFELHQVIMGASD